MARLRFVMDQIKDIEATRSEEVKTASETGPGAMVRLLARILGVGIETADMLVREVLSRNLRDRKAVMALPYVSEGKCAGSMVSGADGRRSRPRPQDHDRCACTKAARRAVALGNERRDARRRGLTPSDMTSSPDRISAADYRDVLSCR
jgi:hypothetical protein